MNIEYDRIEQIVMLFWDEKENFELETTKQKIGTLFKNVDRIYSLESFKEAIGKYPDNNQQFLCFVHLAHLKSNKGYDDFINSKILRDFPNLRFYLITSALRNEVYDKRAKNETLDVFTYDRYQEKIFDKFIPQTKAEIIDSAKQVLRTIDSLAPNIVPDCEYAIITALEEDEMEQILPMIINEGEIKDRNHLISYGHFHTKPGKKIVYASQQVTGMVDAAILATQLIVNFRPKFLIMPGVLGGKPKEVNVGDIIVSTKVFTIDKGKLTSEEILGNQTIKEQINIVENEERQILKKEIESVTTNSSYITKFIRNKDEILQYIKKADRTRKKPINLLFGPIACVRQVIDQKGYFEENILVVDRKTIGLEMESYGIARACELANNSETIVIIAKSVMDNTAQKNDDDKTFAAFTSAKFVEYILQNDLI
jgi:nucleoside phosphorylase